MPEQDEPLQAPPPPVIKPKAPPVRPPTPVQRNLQPELTDDRFPLVLLDIHRSLNGVVTVQLWERDTGKIHKVGSFDAIDRFILTKIDAGGSSVVLADTRADMKLFLLHKAIPSP